MVLEVHKNSHLESELEEVKDNYHFSQRNPSLFLDKQNGQRVWEVKSGVF